MSNLSPNDARTLDKLEEVIDRGLKTFYEVGEALLMIRDNRLYRVTYATFEEYCQERWQMTRQHVNRLIGAAVCGCCNRAHQGVIIDN